MLNSQFMTALAKLESVAATSAEQETINAVRGRYVAKFGTEHPYVAALNKLESVAATDAEKAEINKIRGKFGLFEMTGDMNKQNPELLRYADDEYSAYGDDNGAYDNDPDDLPMSEEDRLSKRYGTPMSVVGEEIVRDLDPEVRQHEDEDDKDERWRKEFDEYERLSFDEDDEETNERNKFYLNELNKDYDGFRDLTIKKILAIIKRYPGKLKDLYDELGDKDFTKCVVSALKSSIIKAVPVKYIAKTPTEVNGKQLLSTKRNTILVPAIQVDEFVYFVSDVNVRDMLSSDTNYFKFDHSIHFTTEDTSWFTQNVNEESNFFADRLLYSDQFMQMVDQIVNNRKKLRGDGLDIDGAYGTISPDTTTPEDAYSDFEYSHTADTDEVDPYSKYN